MKKSIFSLILLASTQVMAQQNESVSMGAGYANHIWYSLENGETETSAKDNWHLAFQVSPYGVSIRNNRSVDMEVWKYPSQGTADWATLDTTGMSATWSAVYNSDSDWEIGAFNQLPSGSYNYGWGSYNTVSHAVEGDQLYVIKLPDDSYRKVWFVSRISGEYIFKIATLDNTTDVEKTFSNTSGVADNALFGYYDIINDQFVNREADASNWDFVFMQYNAEIYGAYGNQRVAGVLQHPDVEVARVDLDNPGDSYDASSLVYVTEVNAIGYDWKSLNYQTFQWEIPDTILYVIKAQNGDYWELQFTDFGGTANGNISFTKRKVGSASIGENEEGFFSIYPNPASGFVTLTHDNSEAFNVSIYSTSGQLKKSEQIEGGSGLNATTISLDGLEAGIYFVNIIANNQIRYNTKLIVR
ncbi:T9SS type A sorting domain-containing protein [Wandonia haliotis]